MELEAAELGELVAAATAQQKLQMQQAAQAQPTQVAVAVETARRKQDMQAAPASSFSRSTSHEDISTDGH